MSKTSTERFSVLLMADEVPRRRALRTSLGNSGFVVEEVSTDEDALQALRKRFFDLALLNLNDTSEGRGINLCREIRSLGEQTGILVIAEPNAQEIVQALDAGGNDYVTPPFRTEELIHRCNVVLQRRIRSRSSAAKTSIVAGDLHLDLDRRELRKAGEVVRLSPTEFNLLALLMKNKGVAMEHTKLLRTIWGPEYGQELEYLRSYVRLLRKKIEVDPTKPKYLVTEPWLG